MGMRVVLALVAGLGMAACEPAEHSEAPAKVETPAPPPAAPAGGRSVSPEARAAMKDVLAQAGAGHTVWILSQPSDPEVASLVGQLTTIFKDAGWEVDAKTVSGITLKPGVMTLAAEEQFPSHVDVVVRALDGTGLDAKSASGYRAYYEAKKQENPGWPGIPMRADQDFVLVVGPKPAA